MNKLSSYFNDKYFCIISVVKNIFWQFQKFLYNGLYFNSLACSLLGISLNTSFKAPGK